MTEATARAALIAEAAEYPTDSDWCGNLIQDLAAALNDAERELAKAWDEGWKTGERWGYWINRDAGSGDLRDLEGTANPYAPNA